MRQIPDASVVVVVAVSMRFIQILHHVVQTRENVRRRTIDERTRRAKVPKLVVGHDMLEEYEFTKHAELGESLCASNSATDV